MNTKFNTIETIRTDSNITGKIQAYIDACDSFEVEASKYSSNSSFVSRKSAEEVSLSYDKAKNSNCEYTCYANAHAAEAWLSKAWNNAN
jgi:hypothetical protein